MMKIFKKGAFKKIVEWLKKIVSKEFDFLRKHSGVAVKVTNVLKNFVESPVTTAIVNIIPGDLDNKILDRLRAVVPKVAMEMALAHGIIQQANGNSDVVAAIVKHLQEKMPDGRVGFWVEFAGRINLALADGEFTLAEAIAAAQVFFAEQQALKAAA